ncbi:hypothetical protein C8N40_104182 [Pontibacter mucosus]|uniref:Uncharacterized protein n=1 Tax=Pontibacter mucosus TaxID=1649266 RepID=A0A2T5YJG3_9BACT|nr:hypothetical protein C8N40_104182 [Pontibacter mucosus]
MIGYAALIGSTSIVGLKPKTNTISYEKMFININMYHIYKPGIPIYFVWTRN